MRMARLLMIIAVLLLHSCHRSAGERAAGEQEMRISNILPFAGERRLPAIGSFAPSYYNIELIDSDTLHPVMKVTYSVRRYTGDAFRWVDAVERVPISGEQCRRLRRLQNDIFLQTFGND